MLLDRSPRRPRLVAAITTIALLGTVGLLSACGLWADHGGASANLRPCQREDLGDERGATIPRGGLIADFERGLAGWNTAGVGDVAPTVDGLLASTGSRSARFLLTGTQERSELILGGDGGGSAKRTIRFYEGDSFRFAFSFRIAHVTYGRPGAHNLIMQFKGADGCSPNFGLQLWSYREGRRGKGGGRGLWSHGSAMGGDRFLARVAHGRWQRVVIEMRASSRRRGFYRVRLNGRLVDRRRHVNTILPGSPSAYIKAGLYRNGEAIPGRSELRLDSVRLERLPG